MNLEQVHQFAPELMKIAQKYGIAKIYIFGSVARRESTTKSDIDFLVELQAGADLFGVAGFGYETEKLLGVPVDIVPMSLLSKIKDRNFVINIQREMKIIQTE